MLGSDFKFTERFATPEPVEKKWGKPNGPRRVKTLAGMKVFGQPIGTIITRDMVDRARRAGKLKGGDGESRYGKYGTPQPKVSAPRAPARAPARAAGRAAAKAPAPKVSAPKGKPASKQDMADRSKTIRGKISAVKDRKAADALNAEINSDPVLSEPRKEALRNELATKAKGLKPAPKGLTAAADAKREEPKKRLTRREAFERQRDAKRLKSEQARADAVGLVDTPEPRAKKSTVDTKALSREINTASTPEGVRAVENKMRDLRDSGDLSVADYARLRREGDSRRESLKEPDLELGVQHDDDENVFLDAVEGAKDSKDLALVERYLNDHDGFPEDRKKKVRAAMDKRKQEIALEAKKPVVTQKPKVVEDSYSFSNLNTRLQSAEKALARGTDPGAAQSIANAVRVDMKQANLNQTQKDHLDASLDAIDERVNFTPRSRAYEMAFEAIQNATTVSEFQQIDRVLGMDGVPPAEAKSLEQHLADRMADVGVEQHLLDSPGAIFDPAEWDTHPSKLDLVPYTPDNRTEKLLMSRRELGASAVVIRAQEKREANPERTPAGKEIEAGAALDEVKNPDGLLEYVKANPNRFTIKKVVSGGQGGAFEVRDHDLGKNFFFKTTLNGQDNGHQNVFMHGEAVNEVVSADFGKGFPAIFPTVVIAAPLVDGVQPVLRMDHLQEHAKKHFGDDIMRIQYDADDRDGDGSNRWVVTQFWDMVKNPRMPKVRDPKNPLAIHIFDYLTNNTDRHMGNFAQVHHKDGTVSFVALDNGASFRGFDQFQGGNLPDQFLDNPETVGYADWLAFYNATSSVSQASGRGHIMVTESLDGYKEHGRFSQKEIEKDAAQILKGFASMSPEQIKADLLRRFPNMPDYERAHLDGAVAILKNRLKGITAHDVAQAILMHDQKEYK